MMMLCALPEVNQTAAKRRQNVFLEKFGSENFLITPNS